MPSSGIALFKIRGASLFFAPHHHFAFLISNFSFKQSFQTESKGKPFPNFPICSKETPVTPRLFQYTLPQQYSFNFLKDYSFSAAMMVSMISAFFALDSMAMPFSCA